MRFIIKAKGNDYSTMLETMRYQALWRANSRKILKALRQSTGLEFQQGVITAHVFRPTNDEPSQAGTYRQPMQLRADFRSDNYKLHTMIHELAHRLINGNGVHPIQIHNSDYEADTLTAEEKTELWNELCHRHLYIFEHDMLCEAYGKEFADEGAAFVAKSNGGHWRAWQWAMSMSYDDRRRAVALLADEAKKRQAADCNPKTVKRVSPDDWYRRLNPSADPKFMVNQ